MTVPFIFVALMESIGAASLFTAAVIIGHEFLKRQSRERKEKEIFDRYHVEEAMRIKARQLKDEY
jgi:hypothetical protein